MADIVRCWLFLVGLAHFIEESQSTSVCGFANSAYSFTSLRLYPLGAPDVSDLRPQNGGHTFDPADAYSPAGDDKFFLETTITLDRYRSAVPVSGVKLVNPSSAISGFKVQFNEASSWDSIPTSGPGETVTRSESEVTTRIIIAFVSNDLGTDSSAQVEVTVPCSVEDSYTIEDEDAGCEDGWVEYEGHCYNFVTSPEQKWKKAQKECEKMDASLVEIETADELLWIRTLLLDDSKGYNHQHKFWTNGWLDKNDNIWKWASDNSPITTLDWGNNEPNNLGNREDRLNLLKSKEYKMNDSRPKRLQGLICKKQM